MLDYLPEIESDFAVFHQEPDPLHALGSPRFFRLARLLGSYDGAVRHALTRDAERQLEHAEIDDDFVPTATVREEPLPDITSIVAMTQNNAGLPSIAYTSGGD